MNQSKLEVGKLRQAWPFIMSLVRIFITQIRTQHHFKTKLQHKTTQ